MKNHMKKILLGTTALIGATAAMAGVALAEDPKVTVGGFATFEAGYVSDDLDAAQRSHGFRNDYEISFSIDGKSDNGLMYGAVADLEADVTADANGEGVNASRTYIYLDGGWGRFELGSNTGAEGTMKVDASNIARATGGIDGDWTYFANAGAATTYIATPDLPLAYGAFPIGTETTDNVTKITYYSPKFNGFQVGASWSPDSADRGQTMTRGDVTAGQSGDNISAAVSYEGQWDQVGIAAAITGEWGDSESAATEDLGAWNAGLKLTYMGFAFAGSYGDWEDSLFTTASGTDADYWTLGAAYDFGPFGASITYLNSDIDPNGGANDFEFDNVVVGADYKLAPGLTPFIEASFYDQDAPGVASDNDGTVVLVGTELAF